MRGVRASFVYRGIRYLAEYGCSPDSVARHGDDGVERHTWSVKKLLAGGSEALTRGKAQSPFTGTEVQKVKKRVLSERRKKHFGRGTPP